MSNNILNIFNSCDIEGISALIDKLEKSSFDYLRLEGDGLSVVIGKNGAGEVSQAPVPAAAPAAAPVIAPVAAPADDAAPAEQGAPAEATLPEASEKAEAAVEEQAGVVIIRAPSQGLFFSQPEPGAPPYVTVGAAVKAGDTVGLMEIMKTYSALTSPVDGEVIAIHVVNEEYLEPGQALISIKEN